MALIPRPTIQAVVCPAGDVVVRSAIRDILLFQGQEGMEAVERPLFAFVPFSAF